MHETSVHEGTQDRPTRAAPATPYAAPAASLVVIALWFGAVACLLELAVLSFRKFVFGHARLLSAESVWMAPLVYLTGFALVGLTLHWAPSRSRPSRSAAIFLLAFLGATSVLLVLPILHPAACLLLGAGVGARIATWSARRHHFEQFVRRSFVPILLVLIITGTAAATVPALRERITLARLPAARAGAPNVLFLILDTVRAWNLGLYGYERPTTPELERFAARGVTFDLALATSPYTLPSHYSMFSGLHPGAMRGIMTDNFAQVIPDSQPMLAELLARDGYATAAFVANLFYATRDFGLARGFARYDDFPTSPGQAVLSIAPGRRITNNGSFRKLLRYHEILNRKPAAHIVDDFLRWQSSSVERPFFAFLNFYDAHEPYLPPEPFESRFVREQPRDGFFYDTHRVQRLVMRDLAERELRAQMDRYDAAIASLDAQLGRLFDTLERRGVLDNTIVIVTSDHGEEFMEHGKVGHVDYLWMSLLHVPLVVVAPSGVPAGLRVASAVSIADLPATVLDLAGLTQPASMPGRSLAHHWPSGVASANMPILAEADPGDYRKSVLDGRYHLIRNIEEPTQLFDIVTDRLEQHDLAGYAALQSEVQRLHTVLDRLLAASVAGSSLHCALTQPASRPRSGGTLSPDGICP